MNINKTNVSATIITKVSMDAVINRVNASAITNATSAGAITALSTKGKKKSTVKVNVSN